MKSALWVVVGVGIGFVAAHFVSKTPQGKQLFEEIDSVTREFTSAVVEAYREREAELRAAVAEAEDAIAEYNRRAQ